MTHGDRLEGLGSPQHPAWSRGGRSKVRRASCLWRRAHPVRGRSADPARNPARMVCSTDDPTLALKRSSPSPWPSTVMSVRWLKGPSMRLSSAAHSAELRSFPLSGISGG